MTGLLDAWFEGLSPGERRQWHGIALCAALFLVHYALFSPWYVEDAAISFSFARNLAAGEGLVAYPGGERVEGFSNPTWTALLAATQALGVSPWIAAKVYGAVFGVACLPLAVAWSRRLLPDRDRVVAVLPALLLALSPQFVLWCAAGLENPLFNALLAVGAVAALREVDHRPTVPWSALAWALLAITRPEGPLYAAVALAATAGMIGVRRGPGAAIGWSARAMAVFAVPFLAWHLWRYLYFGWELPNTYYAKLTEKTRFLPFAWYQKGWWYLRSFALDHAYGFVLPFFVVGLTGLRGWRGRVGLALCVVGGLVLLPGVQWLHFVPLFGTDEPQWLGVVRVVVVVAIPVVASIVGFGRHGWPARLMAAALAMACLFFAHYSGGDWMSGFRFPSLAIVPICVLLADAAVIFADRARQWLPAPGRVWAVALCLPVAPVAVMDVIQTGNYLGHPETSPYDVHRRVRYMQGVQERLFLDHVGLLEVDMGAHMWWSGFDLVDMAGLVDVPIAHHKPHRPRDPFIEQYVYAERRPEFAHVHGQWSRRTHLQGHDAWRDYVVIPPFPTSPFTQHTGNHVRKDVFVDAAWGGPAGRRTPFEGGVNLEGWRVPAPTVPAGGELYLEVGWRRLGRAGDFRAFVVLRGADRVVVREIPPGYDYYPPSRWGPAEVVVGRHGIALPADLPLGAYELGFAVMEVGHEGEVLGAVRAPAGATTGDPVFVVGEVRWPDAVEVVTYEQARGEADRRLAETESLAASGDCDAAREAWQVARRHLGRHDDWQGAATSRASGALARCFATRARQDGASALADIVAARVLDHRDPTVAAAGRFLADRWQAAGELAHDAEDIEACYARWSSALLADPTRSWLRRRTEAVRDEVLATRKRGQERTVPPVGSAKPGP